MALSMAAHCFVFLSSGGKQPLSDCFQVCARDLQALLRRLLVVRLRRAVVPRYPLARGEAQPQHVVRDGVALGGGQLEVVYSCLCFIVVGNNKH